MSESFQPFAIPPSRRTMAAQGASDDRLSWTEPKGLFYPLPPANPQWDPSGYQRSPQLAASR